MAGPLGRLVLLFSFLSVFFLNALGKRDTGIIDDSATSLPPGYNIAFLPAKNGHWNDAASCSETNPFCLNVDPSRCRDSTWTATARFGATGRSMAINFIGDSISVFLTLVEGAPTPANFSTACTFQLDSEEPTSFNHVPRAEDDLSFIYQRNVFTTSGRLLEHGPHTLIISVGGGPNSYLNFDYAVYEFDDEIPLLSEVRTITVTAPPHQASTSETPRSSPTSTANSNTGDGVYKAAIIGGSISGTIVVVAVILFFVYRKRLRQRQAQSDRLTFGVPSTYAGSTRKLSLPFWPHGPQGDDNNSNLRNLTPLPEKRSSYGSSAYYPDKYDDAYVSSPPPARNQKRDRASVVSHGPMLSPANALMQSFYPGGVDKRGSHTTGKLSRLDEGLASPASQIPRHLSTFSDVRAQQTTDTGVTFSSSNVLPLSPDPTSERQPRGGYNAV